MIEEKSGKRLCDVEEPLEPHTQGKSVEISRLNPWIPRLLNNFTGLCIVLFICTLLVRGRGPGYEDRSYEKCERLSSGLQSDNSTAMTDALLLATGHPELWYLEDPQWQRRQASQLASTWGFLSGQLLFASVAEMGQTVESIVESGVETWAGAMPALVAAVFGNHAPQRRAAGEPFLQVAPHAAPDTDLGRILPLVAINKASAGLEAIMGRRLYPFTLEVRAFAGRTNISTQPYAVYEVSTGRIVLDATLVVSLLRFPEDLSGTLAAFAESLFSQLGRFIKAQAGVTSLDVVGGIVAKAAAVAVSVAIGYQVPIWFCVACPAVLGLLAPLLINAGAGAVANAACEHYKLPDADCAELWWSALAVAMILSVASAIPIVYICKLPECAHPKQS